MTVRKPWEKYFMDIAYKVAERSTCDRLHVGAVIVKERNILSTGYNGSMVGWEHCDDVGHLMENNHCIRTVHAEQNAIVQAAKHGTAIEGATMYVTASPCWNCFKLIVNAGIVEVYCGEMYKFEKIEEAAQRSGIKMHII